MELEVTASIRSLIDTALPKSVESRTASGRSGSETSGGESAGARDEPQREVHWMTGGQHPNGQEQGNSHGSNGGPRRRRRSPSRGFFIGMGAVVLFALTLAVVGTIAAQSPSGDSTASPPLPAESPIPFEVTVVPPEATPDPDYTEALPQADEPAAEGAAATFWSAGPTPAAPAPAPPAASDAVRMAAEANETFGVRIVMDGQDWGPDEASQAANVQAVVSAIDRLPDTVIPTVVAHAHGPLAIASNDSGSTLDGWQPYGGHPMTFYTNSDQGPNGYHVSNQVVISVGATSMSIGHEMLHAYQFRNVGPDEYALALLQPEMRSFMEATGWRQTGSDEEVRRAVDQPWSALDSLYVYEGRPLTYATADGATGSITAASPIEAFAIAGSVYYTRPSWMPLPDWPEYWAWFQANVG